MPRTSPRGRTAIVAVTLACLSLASSFPLPTAAADTTVVVCGKVVNSVGWPIGGATVTFVGVSPVETAPRQYTTLSDGSFAVAVFRNSFYEVAVRPAGPSTDHAVYVPWSSVTTASHLYLAVQHGDVTCPDGVTQGKQLEGNVITLDAPGQGFVEVQAVDAVVKTTPKLSGVTITTNLASATTDGTGVVRLACAVGAPTPLTASGTQAYLTSHKVVPSCNDGNLIKEAPVSTTVDMWRKPVVVAVEVTDITMSNPETGLATPVTGATVRLTGQPADLLALDGSASSPCFVSATGYDLPVNASTQQPGEKPYHCVSTTDARGTATLALPWATTPDSTRFRIAVEKTDFASYANDTIIRSADATTVSQGNAALDSNRAVQTPVVANKYLRFPIFPTGSNGPGKNTTDPTQGTVTDQTGDVGVDGVTILFDGPTKTSDVTHSGGSFSVGLAQGDYNLTILGPDFNTRVCTAHVTPSGPLSNVRIAGNPVNSCFRLIHYDQAAVTGTATDAPTSQHIPGLALCAQAGCTTNAQGKYTAEAAPGGSVTLALSSGDWTMTPASPTTGLRDSFVTYDPTLSRATKTVTFTTTASGAPVVSADVCVSSSSGVACGTSDATGTATVTVPWNKRTGDTSGTFNAAQIAVTEAGRHTANPHYANATGLVAPFDVESGSAGPTIAIPLTLEGTATTHLDAVDAHNGTALVAAITVTGAGISCGPTCSGNAPFDAILYHDPALPHDYTASASFAGYVTGAVPFHAGDTVPTIHLVRESTYLAVVIKDAHTGAFVSGAHVHMTNGSDPFDNCTFTGAICAGISAGNGTVVNSNRPLNVPWSAQDEQCIVLEAGSYSVVQVGVTSTSILEENNTLFQETKVCPAILPVPHNNVQTVTITAGRAPGSVSGTVVDFKGAPLPANVSAIPERPVSSVTPVGAPTVKPSDPLAYSTFACNPTSNSPTKFPDCKLPVTTGSFTMTLPHLGRSASSNSKNNNVSDDTWDLNASAPGYFEERLPQVRTTPSNPSGSNPTPLGGVSFKLWPKTFTATVKIQEMGGGECGRSTAGPISVTLTDLETRKALTREAVRQGAFCVATFPGVEWQRFLTDTTTPVPDLDPAQDPIEYPKQSDFYRIDTSYGNVVGALVAPMGPAATEVTVTAVREGASSVNEFVRFGYITGKITDADSQFAVGVAGLAVTATLVDDVPCLGSRTSTTVSGPGGQYALPVTCLGNYDVVVTGSALYQAPQTQTVPFLYEPSTTNQFPATANFAVKRTTAMLWMVPVNLTSDDLASVPNTVIDPQGVDVTARGPAQTWIDHNLAWELPWGVYSVVPQPPQSSPTPQPGTNQGVPQRIFFPPGGGGSTQGNPTLCFVIYIPSQQDAQAGRL